LSLSDTQDRIEKLRRLDVDVDALLEAAVSLAETRRDVRTKKTETPLPPGDPGNLSRVLVVPDVEEEDVDPVALLETVVEMVRVDQHPALALEVARAAPIGSGGPLATVRENPAALFTPEVARHVLRLLDIARRPHRDHFFEGARGPAVTFDHRFLSLPPDLIAAADSIADKFRESFRDPLLVQNEELDRRLVEFNAQKPAPPHPPVDPEDVPLGQPPPRPETEVEAETRQAEAARQDSAWQAKLEALAETTLLVLRHAAQRAARQLLAAAGQNPTDAVNVLALGWAFEHLADRPKSKALAFLADFLSLSTKQINRRLTEYEEKHEVTKRKARFQTRGMGDGHSSIAQCPRKQRKSPVRIQHAQSATKRRTHDEDSRPKQTETPRPPSRLQTRRRAGRIRDQRKPMAPHDRPRRGPSRPAREDGADPSG
jgi:hypothetical protein